MKALKYLSILAAILFTACDNIHPEIDIKLRTDYTEVLKAIEDAGESLSEKLALIEAATQTEVAADQSLLELIMKAIDSLGGTLEDKVEAIKTALKDQTLAMETKLGLIEAAVKSGLADASSQQDLFLETLNSLNGTLESKLALIEGAVKSQTTSLETKLGLIEAAVDAGFTDISGAQKLIADALEATAGTVEEKLSAIEEAVKSQTTSLAAKLALIETAVNEGFADSDQREELLKAAVESLGGTMEEKLAAIESAMQSSSSGLEAKLDLLAAAIESGIGDQNTAIEALKTALDTSLGTLDTDLSGQKDQILQLLDAISGKLTTEELAKVFKDISDAVDSQTQTDEEKLSAIQDIVQKLEGLTQQKFSLTATLPAEYAGIKDAWAAGDVILVFFDNIAAPRHLEMSYDGTSWSCREMNGDTESAGCLGIKQGSNGTLNAVYVPSGSGVSVSASGTDFILGGDAPQWYLSCTKTYSAPAGLLLGELDMQVPDGYEFFFLPDDSAAAGTQIELREPSLTPQPVESIAADVTVNHKSVAHGAPLKGVFRDGAQKGYVFGGILAGKYWDCEYDYHFTLVKGGWKGSYYSKAVSATLYTASADSRCKALEAIPGWTPITDYRPIDIGCDVEHGFEWFRVYWASRNLGATSEDPDDADLTFGDYYAWGETEPKTEYTWQNYMWSTSEGLYTGDSNGLEPGVNLLASDDDVAHVALGGIWRMPGTADWARLCEFANFNWTWSGSGYVVTCKKSGYDGPDGPSLFIPVCGYWGITWEGSEQVQAVIGAYSDGYYWSSQRDFDKRKALYAAISGNFNTYSNINRCYGLSVRPVTD